MRKQYTPGLEGEAMASNYEYDSIGRLIMRKTPLIMFAFAAVLAARAGACSIFMYSVGGRTYFCGNEDWTARDPAMRSYQARKGAYGYVLFGWESYLPSYAQAGINSEGLCFDWAMVQGTRFVHDPSKASLTSDFTIDALRECADVDEVLRFIEGKEIPQLAEEHLMFADASGRSCVLEYGRDGMKVVRNDKSYQYITNFRLTDPAMGWYPCWRYSKLEALFAKPDGKEADLAAILDAVHQEGSYPTIYSYVFDLGRKRLRVFYDHDFRSPKDYSLADLIGRASLVRIGR